MSRSASWVAYFECHLLCYVENSRSGHAVSLIVGGTYINLLGLHGLFSGKCTLPLRLPFFCAATDTLEPRPPPCWGFNITHWYFTLARTPLDEGSALRRDLYLTTHSIHKRHIFMPHARFEPAIPTREWQQKAYIRIIKWRFGRNSSSSLSKKSIISD